MFTGSIYHGPVQVPRASTPLSFSTISEATNHAFCSQSPYSHSQPHFPPQILCAVCHPDSLAFSLYSFFFNLSFCCAFEEKKKNSSEAGSLGNQHPHPNGLIALENTPPCTPVSRFMTTNLQALGTARPPPILPLPRQPGLLTVHFTPLLTSNQSFPPYHHQVTSLLVLSKNRKNPRRSTSSSYGVSPWGG